MNILPLEIIVEEIFPKLQLSDIIQLTTIYPSYLQSTNQYILKIGRQLDLQNINHLRDVIEQLHFKKDIQVEFNRIKHFISLSLHLLLSRYGDVLEDFEEDILEVIERISINFMMDMKENLDVVMKKRIIKPSVLKYIQQNDSRCLYPHMEFNYNVFHHLFPRFEKEMNTIISDFIQEYYISDSQNLIEQSKTEINHQLIRIFLD